MRYILPERIIRLVDEAHSIITGQPADFGVTIDTTDPRMISLIEALGGRLIAPGMDVQVTVTPATSGNPIIDEDDLVKAEPDTPAKIGRVCEICGKPLTDGRAKTCDDPACKKEKTRRYMRAYKQRVMMTATAGAEEELAEDAPLAAHAQESAGTTNPGTPETAAGSL